MGLEHDPVVVANRISDIEQALSTLDELARLPLDRFLEDPHKVSSSKYNLIVAIEASLDLANHLIAKNSLRMPQDNADTFRVLQEHDVLPPDLATRLEDMARFRNLLVHRYGAVDDGRVHAILKSEIGDVERLVERLGKVLEETNGDTA